MKKTATVYILKEIIPIFFIGLMTFTIILLMDKILKLIELIVTRGGSLSDVLMLFLFISPSFLIITIPVAVLLGTLLTFGRLSSDSEITAFKASGMSLYQLFFPSPFLPLLLSSSQAFWSSMGSPGETGALKPPFFASPNPKQILKSRNVFLMMPSADWSSMWTGCLFRGTTWKAF